jgi:hypothetical protein
MYNYRHITYNIAHLPYYADVSLMPYCATSCNMAYLTYFRHGSSHKVVTTIVAYATIFPVLLNRFSQTMPEMAKSYWQAGRAPKICPVGKNLPGVCATGRVRTTGCAGADSPKSVNCLNHGSTHRIIGAVRFMSNLPYFAGPRPCRSLPEHPIPSHRQKSVRF